MTILNKHRTYFLFIFVEVKIPFYLTILNLSPWKKWLEFEKWILHLVTCCSSVFLPPSCTWPPPWAPAWRWTWRSSSLCLVRRGEERVVELCSGRLRVMDWGGGAGDRDTGTRDQPHTPVLPNISQSRRRPLLTRVFSWLKAPTSAFTFKTLLRH